MKIFLYNHTFVLIVLRTNLDDFFVSYQLNSFINKPKDMPAIYSRLHQNILDKFSEAGIEIMSPDTWLKGMIINQQFQKNKT